MCLSQRLFFSFSRTLFRKNPEKQILFSTTRILMLKIKENWQKESEKNKTK